VGKFSAARVAAAAAPGDPRADVPVGNPEASAYLLAAYAEWFPEGTVFLCVVDPRRGRDAPAYS
jgi:S-adenosyl-L-methionine hydrolase (adenosine-forming)